MYSLIAAETAPVTSAEVGKASSKTITFSTATRFSSHMNCASSTSRSTYAMGHTMAEQLLASKTRFIAPTPRVSPNPMVTQFASGYSRRASTSTALGTQVTTFREIASSIVRTYAPASLLLRDAARFAV